MQKDFLILISKDIWMKPPSRIIFLPKVFQINTTKNGQMNITFTKLKRRKIGLYDAIFVYTGYDLNKISQI